MLSSPLILVEDQRVLREELLRELGAIEQDFTSVQSRNPMEISAKIDVAKSALRDGLQAGQPWLIDLLESIQTDLQVTSLRSPAAATATATARPTVNLMRTQPRNEGSATLPSASESETPSSAA
jgi:hypothetical protein